MLAMFMSLHSTDSYQVTYGLRPEYRRLDNAPCGSAASLQPWKGGGTECRGFRVEKWLAVGQGSNGGNHPSIKQSSFISSCTVEHVRYRWAGAKRRRPLGRPAQRGAPGFAAFTEWAARQRPKNYRMRRGAAVVVVALYY